ncbi:hypothetical protein ACFQHR_00860 [Rufibacter roseus]|uniref:Uncharacterized protein n=2 Tax=Rufibacter roseus TaxID=1567108 RepID=A0ABW2DHR5_9BACT
MQKTKETALAMFIGAIIFLALELAVYYVLSTWLVPTDPKLEEEGGTIVRSWNKVMYFTLAYIAIVVSALLIASSQVPREYRRHVMFWFYLSLPTLLVVLLLAFS